MPNWVYHSVSGLSPEVHQRYTNEKGVFDFNRVDPMPEEIRHTTSPGITGAEEVYLARSNDESITEEEKHKAEHILVESISSRAEKTATNVGVKAMQNPDMSLNGMMESGVIEDRSKEDIQDTIQILGDALATYKYSFYNTISRNQDGVISRYADYMERQYAHTKETMKQSPHPDFHNYIYDYSSLMEYGKHMRDLRTKYGSTNWYDWAIEHWGVKWNAGDCEYDPESQILHFDTPWGVPRPIIKTICQENPTESIGVYSEEETGWFEEVENVDGRVVPIKTGEYQYEVDENGEITSTKEVLDPPSALEDLRIAYDRTLSVSERKQRNGEC